MTAREDFTDEEWARLRGAPVLVALGVVEVDPSDTLTRARELHVVDAELERVWNHGSDNELVRLVAYALAEDGADRLAGAGAGVPDEGTVSDRVLAAMGLLQRVLEAKVAGPVAAGFRQWLIGIAEETADAGKEGTAGMAGPRVSVDEATYLARLRQILA